MWCGCGVREDVIKWLQSGVSACVRVGVSAIVSWCECKCDSEYDCEGDYEFESGCAFKWYECESG